MRHLATVLSAFQSVRCRRPVLLVTVLLVAGICNAQQAEPKPEASASQSSAARTQTIEYRNKEYGFCFTLPESWRGYSIVRSDWQGSVNGEHGDQVVTKGPIVSIRNPAWHTDESHQDIPIMIFTRAQWRSLGKFYVSAAPFPPSELGRNSKYVFALPARYNYGFLTGWEEVDQILSGKPLRGCKAK